MKKVYCYKDEELVEADTHNPCECLECSECYRELKGKRIEVDIDRGYTNPSRAFVCRKCVFQVLEDAEILTYKSKPYEKE